jgi:hypothetical protein
MPSTTPASVTSAPAITSEAGTSLIHTKVTSAAITGSVVVASATIVGLACESAHVSAVCPTSCEITAVAATHASELALGAAGQSCVSEPRSTTTSASTSAPESAAIAENETASRCAFSRRTRSRMAAIATAPTSASRSPVSAPSRGPLASAPPMSSVPRAASASPSQRRGVGASRPASQPITASRSGVAVTRVTEAATLVMPSEATHVPKWIA